MFFVHINSDTKNIKRIIVLLKNLLEKKTSVKFFINIPIVNLRI